MYRKLLVVLPALIATSAGANQVSSTVTLTNDYLFNGVSQTLSHPTVQASVDYSHNQVYAGIWTSDVDFDDKVDTEVDVYAGYNFALGDDFNLEVGAAHYMYPGVDDSLDYDYTEAYAGLTAWKNSLVKAWYSNEYFQKNGKAWVVRLQQTFPINDMFGVKAQFNTIKTEDTYDVWYGRNGYHHLQVGMTMAVREINFELAYSDTDINSHDDSTDIADATLWLSIAKTFSY